MIDYIPYKEHKRELIISSLSDRLRENRVDNWQDYEDVEEEEFVPIIDEDVFPNKTESRDILMGRRYE